MASEQAMSTLDAERHHKPTKSPAFKSFMHKRTLSRGDGLPTTQNDHDAFHYPISMNDPAQLLPMDHPHARPLGELQKNRQSRYTNASAKAKDEKRGNGSTEHSKSLHKKTKSIKSLKSTSDKDVNNTSKSRIETAEKMKKPKSSTNLAALLSRPRSMKDLLVGTTREARREKDKENRTPSDQSIPDSTWQPPIYAQFASQTSLPQSQNVEDEISLYTPQNYSPGKQRNFGSGLGHQPTLGRNNENTRPKSTFIHSTQDIFRTFSGDRRQSGGQSRRVSFETPPRHGASSPPEQNREIVVPKRSSRTMAPAGVGSTRDKTIKSSKSIEFNITDIDAELEAMLDRRNIPEDQRHKMRSLAVAVKQDLVRQDWAEMQSARTIRPASKDSDNSDEFLNQTDNEDAKKKKRPRSKTFTLSTLSRKSKESINATEESKPENPFSTLSRHIRTKSWDGSGNAKGTLTSAGAAAASTLISKAKGQTPDDFVLYLRGVQAPESVEVGKLHKLRLLLRNETVAWTDEFITIGGMTEIVGLLYRILKVEWREEHEDALLHEVLLCLKALCTTALALHHLSELQSTLFPTLIHMIFDEEKKGPSEFTTRNIVTSLLFTYLKSGQPHDRVDRARTLLSYLHDPEPKEDARPLPFVLEMRRERPYGVWCREVVNVTKEVFWIFLHNTNVVLLPSEYKSSSPFDTDNSPISTGSSSSNNTPLDARYAYMQAHFPPPPPPVPSAPYVGGVEWDATNYIASHLDLLNGILACLPSLTERNQLREHLRLSGWEKCLGGSLRTCKEKFYGGVHQGLRTWVSAAWEDGWDVGVVRNGPESVRPASPRKSPKKGVVEEAPRIEMPRLDFGVGREGQAAGFGDEGGWL